MDWLGNVYEYVLGLIGHSGISETRDCQAMSSNVLKLFIDYALTKSAGGKRKRRMRVGDNGHNIACETVYYDYTW